MLFYKPKTSLSGAFDPIPVHPIAQEGTGLDYECELVVIIGKRCEDVSETDALDHVLGYSIGNDMSHRDWQLKHGGGQWSLGKGFDGWAPYGPGIVTGAAVKDPHKLKIWTKVNGTTVQVRLSLSDQFYVTKALTLSQDGDTSDMIFNIKQTIAFLSRGTTLMPGDVIFTGT